MPQDILSLGIDVDSFNAQKKAVLNDYISLFNQLSKYDGKVFNPVIGGGLLDLNNSIKETNILLGQLNVNLASVTKPMSNVGVSSAVASAEIQKLTASVTQQEKEIAALKLQLSEFTKTLISGKPITDANTRSLINNGTAARSLATDYMVLKASLKEQGLAYSNAYLQKGPDSKEAKDNLATYVSTSAVIGGIDEKLKGHHSSLAVIGKDLSTYYNRLRIIAYILPGIGVAGIFSLAFEAIEKSSDALGLFDDKLEKYLNNEIAVNKVLKDQLDIYEKIQKSYTELRSVPNEGKSNLEDELSIQQKEGYDQISMLNNKKVKAEADVIQSGADILKRTGNSPETLKLDLERRLSIQKDYANEISIISKKIQNAQNPPLARAPQRDINGRVLEVQGSGEISKSNIKVLEDQKKVLEGKLSGEQDYYSKSYSLLTKYQSDQKSLYDISTELSKARNDDELKRDYEFAQNKVAINKEANEKILKSDRSTEKEKISAIHELNRLTKDSNLNDLNKVLHNISSTQGEKDSAESKYSTENTISNIKTQIQINDLIESYRQKRLSAQEDIDKSTLNEVVNSNEKIYRNEQKSIYDRLTAYSAYVVNKQKIDDVEYKRNIDILSLKTGDKTAQLQIEALNKQRNEQKLSQQANVEKDVYDIVYGGEHKQLDLIKEVNQGRYENTKSQHAKEITELTDSLNRKEISYRTYYRKIEKLQKDLSSKDLESDISVDKQNIFDLESKSSGLRGEESQAKSDVGESKMHLDLAKGEGLDTLQYQKEYDVAVGNEEAISKAIIDIDTATSVAKRKLGDDELRLALLNIEKRKKAEDELSKIITEIGNRIIDGARDQVDAGYQYQEAVVEKKKEIIDEGLQSELNAISISTLSNKDKAALDIQLNEQKRENDKNAALEERRLKRSQAEADRAFTVAKIVWNTEQAISKTYADFGSLPIAFPLAIAQGVLGAVEIATVLATPIPAFKEGVQNFKGGFARTGEDGVEEIREPYKSPYLVYKDTVSYLPAGTDVVPLSDMEVPETKVDTGWDQTRWLAKQMKKNNKEIKNVFRPVINVDLGFENHKRQIFGN